MKHIYEEYVTAIKALSDATRLEIIDMLSCGEMCACDILEAFSITQPTLSYHMKILVDNELVNAVRDGAWMRYTLNKEKVDKILSFFTDLTSKNEDCVCNNCNNKICITIN